MEVLKAKLLETKVLLQHGVNLQRTVLNILTRNKCYQYKNLLVKPGKWKKVQFYYGL